MRDPAPTRTPHLADGKFLLSVSADGSLKIWDAESWQETASLAGDGVGYHEGACFSPDGKYAAAASRNYLTGAFVVQLWRVGKASCAAVFTEHKTYIEHIAFSPNGEFLASGNVEGLVHIRRLSDYI